MVVVVVDCFVAIQQFTDIARTKQTNAVDIVEMETKMCCVGQ